MSLQLFGGNSAYSFNAPIIDQKKKKEKISVYFRYGLYYKIDYQMLIINMKRVMIKIKRRNCYLAYLQQNRGATSVASSIHEMKISVIRIAIIFLY